MTEDEKGTEKANDVPESKKKKYRLSIEESIVLALTLFLFGLIIIFNAVNSPDLAAPVVKYVQTDTSTTAGSEQGAPASGVTSSESRPAYQGKVNINTDDINELMALPGIGEVKAKAILDYRAENGDFTSAEELLEVRGIGEKTLENIKDYITLGD